MGGIDGGGEGEGKEGEGKDINMFVQKITLALGVSLNGIRSYNLSKGINFIKRTIMKKVKLKRKLIDIMSFIQLLFKFDVHKLFGRKYQEIYN